MANVSLFTIQHVHLRTNLNEFIKVIIKVICWALFFIFIISIGREHSLSYCR
jgi:hypothetical protein